MRLRLYLLGAIFPCSAGLSLTLLEPPHDAWVGPSCRVSFTAAFGSREEQLEALGRAEFGRALRACATVDGRHQGCFDMNIHNGAATTLHIGCDSGGCAGWHALQIWVPAEQPAAPSGASGARAAAAAASLSSRFYTVRDPLRLTVGDVDATATVAAGRLPAALSSALGAALAKGPVLGAEARDALLRGNGAGGGTSVGRAMLIEGAGAGALGAVLARSLALLADALAPQQHPLWTITLGGHADDDASGHGGQVRAALDHAIIGHRRLGSVRLYGGGGEGVATWAAWAAELNSLVLGSVGVVALLAMEPEWGVGDRARALGFALSKAHSGVLIWLGDGGLLGSGNGAVNSAGATLAASQQSRVALNLLGLLGRAGAAAAARITEQGKLRMLDYVDAVGGGSSGGGGGAQHSLYIPALPEAERRALALAVVARGSARSHAQRPSSGGGGSGSDGNGATGVSLDEMLPERVALRAQARAHYASRAARCDGGEASGGSGGAAACTAQPTCGTMSEGTAAARGRSCLRVHLSNGMNAAAGHNVCLRPFDGPEVLLYRGSGIGTAVIDPTVASKLRLGHNGFAFGWRWSERLGPAPQEPSSRWHRSGSVIVVRPAFPRHTTHFAEAVALLFHAALHHEDGEWHWLGLLGGDGNGGSGSGPATRTHSAMAATELWLPTVSRLRDELAWNHGFLDILLAAVAEALGGAEGARPLQVRFAQDIPASPLHCFAHLGLVGMATHEFGFFADAWEAQLFREVAWRRLAMLPPPHPQPHPNAKLRTLVAHRLSAKRRMLNQDEVLQMLLATGLVELDYDGGPGGDGVGTFEGASFREQLAWMQATDLLVAVHGGALNNAIFMRAGSAVIDILPSNFVEFEWSNALTIAGMHYLFLPNDRGTGQCEPHPAACRDGHPFQSGRMACLGIRNCDVTVWLGGLDMYVRQAAFLVRNLQRRVVKGGGSTTWNRGSLPDGRFDPLT